MTSTPHDLPLTVALTLITSAVIVSDTQAMDFEEVRRGRVHMIRRKRLPLETGVDGVTMEYSLSVVPDGYFTPRHRHNFDQIRYTLSGVQSTGLGDLAAGECGYFPEGSHYGPQQQKGECECLVLQFQGASGEHLLSNEEMNATYDKLIKAGGKFENGVYKGFIAPVALYAVLGAVMFRNRRAETKDEQ